MENQDFFFTRFFFFLHRNQLFCEHKEKRCDFILEDIKFLARLMWCQIKKKLNVKIFSS
jgi:hypothetical protein